MKGAFPIVILKPNLHFRAHNLIPEFHENSTALGITGSWKTDGELNGLCLSRMKSSDERVYLSFPFGVCEHAAEIKQACLSRTKFVIELLPASIRAMDGIEKFQIEFVLTDREFDQVGKALAEIFRGVDRYTAPVPIQYNS